ncbi:putative odorant-binding protein A5 [Planococcus citri]|uniref:putative odorant-binding protein A5 n=1 Tax=Planococcus citri TaxID=170843 RepID=UPI0031FA3F33
MINAIIFHAFYLLIWSLSHVFSVDQNLINHFSESKLVPELIPEAPTELCHVTYSEYGVVQPGSVLTDEQSFVQPSITWDADPNSLYTLYWAGIASQRLVATRSPDYEDMTYEDRIKTEYSIMVVVNIPGNNYSVGLDLWSYVPPGDPPVKKLRDRYAILIYKQQDTIVPPTKKIKYDEYEFQTFTPLIKFVKQYNLIGPVAGNMFYTQKDDNERI